MATIRLGVTARSPAGMHGLSLAPEDRPVASVAPRKAFSSLRLDASDGGLFTLPVKPALRNGLSLPTSGCSFPNVLSRIVVPGLLLQRPAKLAPDPFGSELLSSFRRRNRGKSPLVARYLCSRFAASMALLSLLPFRTEILPAHRSSWFATAELTIANVRSPSTPRRTLGR